jgi:hypothetical protein
VNEKERDIKIDPGIVCILYFLLVIFICTSLRQFSLKMLKNYTNIAYYLRYSWPVFGGENI